MPTRYIVDDQGTRTAVVLDLAEYERLVARSGKQMAIDGEPAGPKVLTLDEAIALRDASPNLNRPTADKLASVDRTLAAWDAQAERIAAKWTGSQTAAEAVSEQRREL